MKLQVFLCIGESSRVSRGENVLDRLDMNIMMLDQTACRVNWIKD